MNVSTDDYKPVEPVPEGSEEPSGPIVTRELRVAPDEHGEQNLIRASVVPVASYRLDDINFDFDSSFIRPDAAVALTQLALLRREHPNAPLSIFGHADPTGQDDYNKNLSGRRAKAVYGLLTRDMDQWEWLFNNPLGRDDWGVRRIQILLSTAGQAVGPIDGVQGAQTNRAIREFQETEGLAVDGIVGPNTRNKLFEVYMDKVCKDTRGGPFKLTADDFLAAGADDGGKGDYQGCSEFNPVMVFSAEENARYSLTANHAERNRENEPNRRVIIFLFRPGSKIDPQCWPCPRADEGVDDCHKRFWSDGEARRSPQEHRREYRKSRDTFACRFYDRIVRGSQHIFGPPPEIAGFFGRPRVADNRTEQPHNLIVPHGHKVVLHWQAKGATKIRIEAMTLRGEISNIEFTSDAGEAPNKAVVAPTEDMVYTLCVTGETGVVEYSEQVKVLLSPTTESDLPPVIATGADLMELRYAPDGDLDDALEETG